MWHPLLLVVALTACAQDAADECVAQPSIRDEPTDALTDAALAVDRFGLGLLRARTDENAFLSPLDIATALGMTLAGAEGATAEQLRAALAVDGLDDVHAGLGGLHEELSAAGRGGDPACPTWTFQGGSAAFLDQRLEPVDAWVDVITGTYGAAPVTVDFEGAPDEAADAIDAWADAATGGNIDDVAEAADFNYRTLFILATAVWFKGAWEQAFDPAASHEDTFFLADGTETTTTFMHGELEATWARFEGAYAVELPYRGEDASMFVVVPDEVDGLSAVLDALDTSTVEAAFTEGGGARVELYLPRFEVRSTASLVLPLQALGMTDLFDEALADLSGIAPPPGDFENVYVSEVRHDAWIRVDEEGTEAAAVTQVEGSGTDSAAPTPEIIRADRPFLYVVRDRVTGAWLFAGRLDAPPDAE